MYQPEYVIIKNFGSISYLKYEFKIGISQIIQGKNLEDKGQKSNGVGKSSFNDAIGFGLSGISLRGLNMEELIRDGEEESYLELSLKSIDNTKHLLIQRTLSRKKAQLVHVFLNGVALHKDDHDVNHRNKSIFDQLDITKEDLFQFFIITKERFKPYFKMSDNEKKEITNRFSKADRVDKVFPKLEKELKDNEVKLSETKVKINQLQGKLETYKSEKDNYEANSKEKKDKLKQNIQEEILKKESEIVTIDQRIDQNNESIPVRNQDIEAYKKSIEETTKIISEKEAILQEINLATLKAEEQYGESIKTIDAELDVQSKIKIKLSKELKDLNGDLYEIKSLVSQIELKLQSSINCPSCSHEFVLKSEETVDELKDKVKECQIILSEIDLDIISKAKEIDTCDMDIGALDEQIRTLSTAWRNTVNESQKQDKVIRDYISQISTSKQKSEKLVISLENEIVRINQNIESDKNAFKIVCEKISELRKDLVNLDQEIDNKEAIERYDQLILDSETELTDLNNQQNKEVAESQRINAWIIRFKSFKSFLANQSIKNIEDLTNSYLQKMNTDLTIEISSHSKKKKDVKEKITEKILRNGFPIGSYGRFSGGERGRIDFGSILANQTLINTNSNQGLDFILIDEVLESLDSLGIESIIKAMDGIDKTLLLVTQNEINSLPQQTLTFIKQNGSTQIE